MNVLFLCLGIPALAIYLYQCAREKSYLNALSPYFALYFVVSFIFEPIFFYTRSDYDYDVPAFIFVYICDFAYFLGLALAYGALVGGSHSSPPTGTTAWDKRGLGPLSWVFLTLSALIFLPVALEFVEYVFTDPRRLYELTRSGYGQYLFVSTLMLNLGVICFLFSKKKGAVLFVPFVIVLSVVKGAKGPILELAQIFAMWAVYVRNWRIRLGAFLMMGTAGVMVIIGLFAVTLRGLEPEELFGAITDYSDYNRHASLTVTDPIGPFYGKLALENYVYSRLPRVIDKDKPKDFGTFYLARYYFPDDFFLDSGAPAFGAGVYIADFGVATPLITLLGGLLCGYLLGLCVRWVRRGGGVAAFIPLLYFANVGLIPIPNGFLIIEHWVLGQIVRSLSRIRLRFGPRARSGVDDSSLRGHRMEHPP
jgi:O-antigen polymerase